jgi:hypothetical protein
VFATTGSPRGARRGRAVRWLAAVGVVALAVTGCAGDPEPVADSSTTTPAPTRSPTTTVAPTPSPRDQAAALAGRLRGRPLDLTYRIRPRNLEAQDGLVRIQRARGRYRIDVTRGASTSSLRTAPRGAVSCQSGPRGRTCLLVAGPGQRPPALFDPGLQRILTQAVPRLADPPRSLVVRRDGTWRAPHGYGTAVCFRVRGRSIDEGRYCLLDSGRYVGTPVLITYRSGQLVIVSIDNRVSAGFALPPVAPTPLPD